MHGKKIHGCQVPAEAQIQYTCLYTLPDLRTPALRIAQVRRVPNLLPGTCLQGPTSWREEGQLVKWS